MDQVLNKSRLGPAIFAVLSSSLLCWLTKSLRATSRRYFLPAASTLRVGSAPFQVTSAVGP